MQKSALTFTFSLFTTLLLSVILLAGCSDSNNTVHLRETSPVPGDLNVPGKDTQPNPPNSPPSTPIPAPKPSAPPAPAGKVARIICESQATDGMTFNTLRGDVVSSYMMPSLTLYVGNQSVLRVKSPTPLQSNGEQALLVLRAQEDNFAKWKIYKTTANLLTSRGDLQVISNYQGLNQKANYAYQVVKLENRLLAANLKRTTYVYPNDAGTFILESLKGSKLVLPFSADNAFSPRFVGDDNYLRFDHVGANGVTLTQKFYNFATKKTLSLPTPFDSKDFQLFGYISPSQNSVLWAEGRPDGIWKLRSMSLNAPGKAVTLGSLPGDAHKVILPMVITESQGDLLVAYGEEELAPGPHTQLYLKTGVLHLVKANSKLLKLTGVKTVDYSPEIKGAPNTQQTLLQGALRSLFFEPISGKLYASVVSQGGLASFDLKQYAWETHAMVASIFGCLNPEWGMEVPNE